MRKNKREQVRSKERTYFVANHNSKTQDTKDEYVLSQSTKGK